MDFLDAKNWLVRDALPLWLKRGVDLDSGGFVESLSLEGEPLSLPRRCTVQARQIYVFRTALELGLCDANAGRNAVESGTKFLTQYYSLPSGAFRHAVAATGAPTGEAAAETPDLYAQSFALFGLANSFAVLGRGEIRERAQVLLRYLLRERALPNGGFSELEGGRIVRRSNPHMHLFEAAIAWMEVDTDPAWHRLASDVLNLCLARFCDPATGAIGEYFNENWERELVAGRFIFEPGHLFEWSWLMGRFQALSGRELGPTRLRLFELGESTGIWPERRSVYDQVWSDFTPKTRSSRFWPQCERIKAASTLGREAQAREGMEILFRFFAQPVPGLWSDIWDESGNFPAQPAKASSLYHILGAITEAQAMRSTRS